MIQVHGFVQDSMACVGGQGALPQHQVGKRRILYLDMLWKWKTAQEQAMMFWFKIRLIKSLSEMSLE